MDVVLCSLNIILLYIIHWLGIVVTSKSLMCINNIRFYKFTGIPMITDYDNMLLK